MALPALLVIYTKSAAGAKVEAGPGCKHLERKITGKEIVQQAAGVVVSLRQAGHGKPGRACNYTATESRGHRGLGVARGERLAISLA